MRHIHMLPTIQHSGRIARCLAGVRVHTRKQAAHMHGHHGQHEDRLMQQPVGSCRAEVQDRQLEVERRYVSAIHISKIGGHEGMCGFNKIAYISHAGCSACDLISQQAGQDIRTSSSA